MSSNDDDDIALSPEAFQALQEFLKEKNTQEKISDEVKPVVEDWNLSQFWVNMIS